MHTAHCAGSRPTRTSCPGRMENCPGAPTIVALAGAAAYGFWGGRSGSASTARVRRRRTRRSTIRSAPCTADGDRRARRTCATLAAASPAAAAAAHHHEDEQDDDDEEPDDAEDEDDVERLFLSLQGEDALFV